MKNRILTFVIGILTGLIIATICFLIYIKQMSNIPNYNHMPPNGNKQINGNNKNMINPREK